MADDKHSSEGQGGPDNAHDNVSVLDTIASDTFARRVGEALGADSVEIETTGGQVFRFNASRSPEAGATLANPTPNDTPDDRIDREAEAYYRELSPEARAVAHAAREILRDGVCAHKWGVDKIALNHNHFSYVDLETGVTASGKLKIALELRSHTVGDLALSRYLCALRGMVARPEAIVDEITRALFYELRPQKAKVSMNTTAYSMMRNTVGERDREDY